MSINQACQAARKGSLDEIKAAIRLSETGQLNLNQTSQFFESGWGGSGLFSSSETTIPSKFLGPCTPLGIAAAYGHFDVVKELVESGEVDVNGYSGRDGDYTPLDCAMTWGGDNALQTQEYLISKGGAKFALNYARKRAFATISTSIFFLFEQFSLDDLVMRLWGNSSNSNEDDGAGNNNMGANNNNMARV